MSLPKKTTFWIITALVIYLSLISEAKTATDDQKSDVTSRQSDVAARVNLGTALSLILPVALTVALVALIAPVFQGLFAAPLSPFITGGGPLGFAKKRSLFSGVNQESLMQILEAVTKAFESFATPEKNTKSNVQ